MRAVDCQGFAGGYTLGAVQAGWDVVAKYEQNGFGVENTEANRHLLGDYELQAHEPWEPTSRVPYFFGNPPCSGFSMLNTAAAQAKKNGRKVTNHRGADSPINDCMWAFIDLAGLTTGSDGQLGPEVVAFESVQGGGKRQGRQLMRDLRTKLEGMTGRRYNLTHVFMNADHCGAAQARRRYFAMFTREELGPFGVTVPQIKIATVADAIQDLVGYPTDSWDTKHKTTTNVWMRREGMSPKGVADAHINDHSSMHARRILKLLSSGLWAPGMNEEPVALQMHERGMDFSPPYPDDFDPTTKRWGFYQVRRLKWDQQPYVLAGNGLQAFVHPLEDRLLTVREGSRMMGYPDTWSWSAASNVNQASAWMGKGLAVQAGRWISKQVMDYLNGEDFEFYGKPEPDKEVGLEDRELVINTTNISKGWSN